MDTSKLPLGIGVKEAPQKEVVTLTDQKIGRRREGMLGKRVGL